MSYEYADRTSAQCCMRAAAKGGNPCLGPKSVVKVCQEDETLAIDVAMEFLDQRECFFVNLRIITPARGEST